MAKEWWEDNPKTGRVRRPRSYRSYISGREIMIAGRWIDDDFDAKPEFEGVEIGADGNVIEYGRYHWLMNDRQKFAWSKRVVDPNERQRQSRKRWSLVSKKIANLGKEFEMEQGE